MQLLSVIVLEVAVSFVVGIVRSYISDMIIEQKYGFNRTSMKTFVTDCIRNLIIEFVLSLLLAMLMWGSHAWFGDWMILVFAVAMLLFSLLISFMYPLFSRIGNKFTPLEDGELKDRLMELLTKHGYQVKAIEVMDASRRTTKLNAYFTGFGKMKTIVLYDNLVNAMEPDEICAVFAHELGHGLHKDVLKGQILNFGNMLLMGVMVWVVVSNPAFCEAFGFESINYGFTYVVLAVCIGLLNPVISLLTNARSRRAEYRADKQAVAEGYGPAMITALKKLARENFAHLAPSRVNVVLEYSHPPLSERIAAVEKEMEKNMK
jgi:STE24 endopeptidase